MAKKNRAKRPDRWRPQPEKTSTAAKPLLTLTPLASRLLELLAVVYCPTNTSEFYAGQRSFPGAACNIDEFNAAIEVLVNRELVVRDAQGRVQCPGQVADDVVCELIAQKRLVEVGAAAFGAPLATRIHGRRLSFEEVLAEMRHALLIGDDIRLSLAIRLFRIYFDDEPASVRHPYSVLFDRPLRTRMIRHVLGSNQGYVYHMILVERCRRLESLEGLLDSAPLQTWSRVVDQAALFVGRADLRSEYRDRSLPEFEAAEVFLRGDKPTALTLWSEALVARRKAGSRKSFLENPSGIWLLLTRLDDGGKAHLKRARSDARLMWEERRGLPEGPAWGAILAAAELRHGEAKVAGELLSVCLQSIEKKWDPATPGTVNAYWAYFALAATWVDMAVVKKLEPILEAIFHLAQANGYSLIAFIAAEVLGHALERAPYAREAEALHKANGYPNLIPARHNEGQWERALEALEAIPTGTTTQDKRLTWWLQTYSSGALVIEAREQRRSKDGSWSKGRKIADRRLAAGEAEFTYFTQQDHLMRACFRIEAQWGQAFVTCDHLAWVDAAVGHPLVFRADGQAKAIVVLRVEPELLVRNQPDGFSLELANATADLQTSIRWESPTRLVVNRMDDAHRRIAAVLRDGLRVPTAGKAKLLAALASLGTSITMASELTAQESIAEEFPCDSRIHARFRREGSRYLLKLRVTPLGGEALVFAPGVGPDVVIGMIDGVARSTRRDRALERAKAWDLVSSCPALSETDGEGFEWQLEGDAACLEALSTFQGSAEDVVIEWDGKPALHPPLAFSSTAFNLSIRGKADWFELGGEVEVDAGQVVALSELLELLNATRSRFVTLDSGQVVALTETLKSRLLALEQLGESTVDGIRIRRCVAPAAESLLEDMGVSVTGRAFKTLTNKLRGVNRTSAELPSTFAGELRPYQHEGFQWMMRLSEVSFGACLADDMGIGKTIQALAILLARAPGGPALVIAPTSVVANWMLEAARFAPTLRLQSFAQSGRADLLAGLGAFDVLVTSYGLLNSEQQQLAAVKWHSLILDEAQAIKNEASQRFKASLTLQADFRLITTGTPVENHLGELWALMHFLNPGLLGTRQHFERRFAVPIEKNGARKERRILRELIRPFVLRRKKSDVLEDLPSRTEVNLRVELSDDERAFYEAVRRRALANIEADEGDRRFRILAELTRLRQACCAPQLLQPELGTSSSKLEALDELVAELIQGGHKALVFSQFVSFLSIVRSRLDASQIPYQYLDGSTPQKARAERVAAFQRGEGELFLISLKAGGTGLNLTAADYVVHLDPWWNPAVEDQASDRAHRIGQTRPVTIYRFVTVATVEERIVELHHEKRALADSLLEGTDTAARLDIDSLWALMREAGEPLMNPDDEPCRRLAPDV